MYTMGSVRRQVAALLLIGSMPQDAAHRVHLRVRGGGVAARRVDLLQDGGGVGDAQARAPVRLGDERAEPPGVGERLHEGVGILPYRVQLAPVGVGESRAQVADGVADGGPLLAHREVHQDFGSGKCARVAAAPRLGTMKLRVITSTIVPSCLMPRWRTFTTPHPGRDRDSRAWRTSLSA